MMIARLQVQVERGFSERLGAVPTQGLGDGVPLGMRAAVGLMPALAQYRPGRIDHYGADHRVGAHVAGSARGQLQAALHPSVVVVALRAHTASIRSKG